MRLYCIGEDPKAKRCFYEKAMRISTDKEYDHVMMKAEIVMIQL